ncbi:MAG: HNH endonuclease [Deltaproteobacteria bacterium]|nr:HNH endonuclease [Deltaproteobacteria bacterium]
MNTRTLLLNSWGMPHAVLTWMDAITLAHVDKATVLEEYDETVSSPSTTMYVPAVMQLKRTSPAIKRGIKFSKVNVFTRDGWRCQYCGGRFAMNELNYDHVVPRKQGGKTNWENIVTSCYPCNARKAGRTPEQAGMKLLRRPARPHALPLHAVYIAATTIPEPWKPYLDLSKAQKHGAGFFLVAHHAA